MKGEPFHNQSFHTFSSIASSDISSRLSVKSRLALICVMSTGCQVSQGKGETVTVHRFFCKDYVILTACILLQPPFVVLEVVLMRPAFGSWFNSSVNCGYEEKGST